MVKQEKTSQSSDPRLKGNIMIGRKANLQRFENVSVSIMKEFPIGVSNPVQESQPILDDIDTIIQMARKRWA